MKLEKINTIGVVSLGCSKNRVDTERMLGILKAAGYSITNDPARADAIIVNTCGFIESAKQESIDTIFEMAAYKRGQCRLLIVTGCLSERYRAELQKELPEVDILLGVREYEKLVPLLARHGGSPQAAASCAGRLLTTPPHTAYLRIADGCDNRCSYCAIPSIRGPFKSERSEALLEEARLLAQNGVRELILIAQDTTRFGLDTGESLPELIDSLSEISGVEWIRLMYAYPASVSDELIETLLGNPKALHYLDLPIQHADDELLRSMNRRGAGADIARIVRTLREADPDFVLRTSIITGFPGETEEKFRRLIRFLYDNEFDHLGAFAYSPEDGTPAAAFTGAVGDDVKRRRLNSLMSRARATARRRGRNRLGKTVRVLAERVEEGLYAGRSFAEAPDIDGEIYFSSEKPLEIGSFASVRLQSMKNYDFWGETI